MKIFTLLLTVFFSLSVSYGQNLIENGDFEFPGTALDTVPAPWGGFKNRIISDTILNSFVGQVENGDGSLFQEFGVAPGDTFIVEFNYKWVNSAAANSNMVVRVKNANNLPTNLDLIGGTIANGFKLNEAVDQWFYKASFRFVPPTGIDSVRLLFFKGNGNKPLNLDSVSVILQVPCSAPVAAFAITDTNELDLQFTNQSTGEGLSYQWTFGDGNSSTDESPMHSYGSAGTYEVCLQVTDTCGTPATTCESVTLSVCSSIVSAFVVSDTNGLELQFSNESVADEPTYLWEFGDGNSSTELSPSHLYDEAGVYEVCLTVTDTCGATSTVCDSITVDGLSSIFGTEFPYELSVYPNPATDHLNVSTTKNIDRVEVFSMMGERVLEKTSYENQVNLNIGSLARGTYLLKVYVGDSVGAFRIMRQ